VFSTGRISTKSAEKFKKLMKAFRLLIELYEVDDYMFCATSAMRESENGADLVTAVQEEIGIFINIIDGNREAEFINRAISSYLSTKRICISTLVVEARNSISTSTAKKLGQGRLKSDPFGCWSTTIPLSCGRTWSIG